MQPDRMTDNAVTGNLDLQVHIVEKRESVFVLEPAGSVNTITSKSLQEIVERICASKPHIILFDLGRVGFINSKGLRVILNVYRAVNAYGGRVVLMNFQPHIKEVFEVINALPEQRIFASWLEFDHYLEAVQKKRCADLGGQNKSEIEADNGIIFADINANQRNATDSRMYF